MMNWYNVNPITGTQKSFYGKAQICAERGVIYLKSYETLVACFDDNGFHRMWDGWSLTTSNHVNAFRVNVCGMDKLNKKEWEALPVVDFFTM